MGIDLSKVQLASDYNAFKNDDVLYSGTYNFPTTLTPGFSYISPQTFNIGTVPQFMKFFAYFIHFADEPFVLGPPAGVPNPAYLRWYESSAAFYNIGLNVTGPSGNVGAPLNAALWYTINGTNVTVQGWVFNPYSNNITVSAVNVPFVFVEYSLAN